MGLFEDVTMSKRNIMACYLISLAILSRLNITVVMFRVYNSVRKLCQKAQKGFFGAVQFRINLVHISTEPY